MTKYYNYTWNQFDRDCKKIVKQVKNNNWKFDYVYGPPRGGVCLAVKLSHMLKIKYLRHLPTSGRVLICEDVSDTGETLLKINKKRKFRTVTLFMKPQTKYLPDMCCRVVNNDVWINYPWEK